MREQIKLILDTKVLSEVMEVSAKIVELQRKGYEVVDTHIVEQFQDYYLEKVKKESVA